MRTRARANDETSDATERAPMTEISPNASPEQVHREELPVKTPAKTPVRKVKGKGRAKKGKKAKGGEEEDEAEVEVAADEEQAEPETEAAENPVQDAPDGKSKTATNTLREANRGMLDVAQGPTNDDRPATPPSKPVRFTRRQLAIQEEEQKQTQLAASPSLEPAHATEEEVLEALVKTAEEEAIVEKTTEDTDEKSREVTIEEPVRLTRRQQAKLEEEKRQAERVASPPRESGTATQEVPAVAEEATIDTSMEDANAGAEEVLAEEVEALHEEPVKETQDELTAESGASQEIAGTQELDDTTHEMEQVEEPSAETATIETEPQIEATAPEAPTPSVEITSEPEPKTLAAERPTEDVATPLKSHSSSRRASRSPSKSPMRLEESFEAIDALEEALENVTSVGSFSRPNVEASPAKENFTKSTTTPNTRSKTPKKAPVVAAAKVSRTPTVVGPKSMKPMKSSIARASSVRVAPSKEARKPLTETVDYLASKRRPVSVSFPTPPPPPKGRAPTKPTFQLSSSDVVAKLKVQKEERQKREAEGVVPKTRPISMPPLPKSNKPLTKATFQLPGEKVAEKLKAQKEERLKREAEPPYQAAPAQRPTSISMAPHAKSTKPLTKATFELPGAAVAEKLRLQREEREKRMEEAPQQSSTKQRPSNMHMAPRAKSSKPPTKATFELPGAAVAEKLRVQKEEREKRMEEAEAHAPKQSAPKQRPSSMHMAPHTKSTKAPTKATFELPGAAVAEKLRTQKEERLKRMEEAEAAKKEAAQKARQAFRKPVALPTRTVPGLSFPPSQQRSTSLASKRSSMSLSTQPFSQSRSTSTSSANRQSAIIAPKSVVTPMDVVQQKVKGREVFNRDRMEKETRDKERREKEDAAKKARAEAAERGRIASREWAEKQKRKMVGV
jgi:hypothetical protein